MEELRAQREMQERQFEALMREMDARFETLNVKLDSRFEALLK